MKLPLAFSALVLLLAPVTATAASRVLVFSKATASHGAVAEGVSALRQLGRENGWSLDTTENAADFTYANLQRYDVVVWLNASGDALNQDQRTAYERFHRGGKGTVAIHAASVDAAGGAWSWFHQLASVNWVSSAPIQKATLIVQDRTHPATFALPRRWEMTDEWPSYSGVPGDALILITIEEGSYQPGVTAMQPRQRNHPLAWCRDVDGGRFFYTGLGHRAETYTDRRFLSHLAGGIEWAAGKMSYPVKMATDGAAMILREFDGHAPNGVWERQTPPDNPKFTYEVSPVGLHMHDDDPSRLNQHLVRRGLTIDPKRPYAIEGKFIIPSPLHENAANSFAVNFNVSGAEGDVAPVSTWSLNVDLHGRHGTEPDEFSLGGLTGTYGGVLRFMGFEKGRFMEIGHMEASWGEPDVEYGFRIYVNASLNGRMRDKLVSMVIFRGDHEVEKFQIDYTGYPYQPDYARPVRFGFNTHGASWILRDLKLYYLDVPVRLP